MPLCSTQPRGGPFHQRCEQPIATFAADFEFLSVCDPCSQGQERWGSLGTSLFPIFLSHATSLPKFLIGAPRDGTSLFPIFLSHATSLGAPIKNFGFSAARAEFVQLPARFFLLRRRLRIVRAAIPVRWNA